MASGDVTATEAARNLSEYLNRVAYRGERFVIRRGNRAIAELQPAAQPLLGPDLLALFERLPKLSPDEIDAFQRDIDEARNSLPPLPTG